MIPYCTSAEKWIWKFICFPGAVTFYITHVKVTCADKKSFSRIISRSGAGKRKKNVIKRKQILKLREGTYRTQLKS